MKLSLIMGGKKIKLKPPDVGVDKVTVPDTDCPHCKEPLAVQGGGKRIKSHDTYEAPAGCLSCEKMVGYLELQMNTLFGLEEDARIASMGIRIY